MQIWPDGCWGVFHSLSSFATLLDETFNCSYHHGFDKIGARHTNKTLHASSAQEMPLVGLDVLSFITLWQTDIAIENGHLQLICPLKMVIFHSYVSLPEGIFYSCVSNDTSSETTEEPPKSHGQSTLR